MIKSIIAVAAPIAIIFGLGAYDMSETTTHYRNDITLSGHPAIFQYTKTRSGLTGKSKLVGYGHARLIGVGCDTVELGKFLVANEEDHFPACDAIMTVERF